MVGGHGRTGHVRVDHGTWYGAWVGGSWMGLG